MRLPAIISLLFGAACLCCAPQVLLAEQEVSSEEDRQNPEQRLRPWAESASKDQIRQLQQSIEQLQKTIEQQAQILQSQQRQLEDLKKGMSVGAGLKPAPTTDSPSTPTPQKQGLQAFNLYGVVHLFRRSARRSWRKRSAPD